jgi:hypothetical protein
MLPILAFSAINLPKNLGSHGKTYEIQEPNMMILIEESINDLNQTKLQNELDSAVDRAYTVALEYANCSETRRWRIDPSFTATEDVLVEDSIVVKKGSIVNPLNYSTSSPLFVLNATSRCQDAFLKKVVEQKKGMVMVTDGDLKPYMPEYLGIVGKASNALLDKFNITCTPALILQKSNYLEVTEYDSEALKKEVSCE